MNRTSTLVLHLRLGTLALAMLATGLASHSLAQDLPEQAARAMRRAAEYYRREVAVRGGYVYYYSPDLSRRLGEGVASPTQIWVQPPGTPTVGLAYLAAYEATGDAFYLEAAQAAARALMYGQLKSGGWTNSIDFDPRGATADYRNGRGRGKNNSTLDDGISQAAIRLLVQTDRALRFRDAELHQAAVDALEALLQAQFPNGGFPQVWTEPVPSPPVVSASYPDYDWRSEGRIKNYWDMYTLNDGVAGQVAQTLIDAHDVYQDSRYREALIKLGQFLIRAQMPDPQPAWAQQYNYQMQPIWARRFEPPAIAARESEDAIRTLLQIYDETEDAQFLEPIPAALDYLERSELPDGQLARYYELRTNRPLYMERQRDVYRLTYDDSRLPKHYGWQNPSHVEPLRAELRARTQRDGKEPGESLDALETDVRRILEALDSEGRWITTYEDQLLVGQPKFRPGDTFLSSAVFAENLETLSRYLREVKR